MRVVSLPLMLAVVGCAGTEPQAEFSQGHAIGETDAYGAQYGQWVAPSYPALSYEDREAIGRITYAEAGNQGETGLAAVIFTILNRVSSGQFGDSVQEVIDAPNQFEPATRVGGWRYLTPLNSWQTAQFEGLLDSILTGQLPDVTNGALFFQNARIVAARAARGSVSSYLVDFGGTPPVAEIGDHRFYDWRAMVNLAARRRPSYDVQSAYYDSSSSSYQQVSGETSPAEPASDDTSSQAAWEDEQTMPIAIEEAAAYELPDAAGCTLAATC